MQPGSHNQSCRFLALGDSYTIGEGVPAAASWPCVLARQLRADGVDVEDPRIVAVTGWTTDELAAAMDATSFDAPYALVTLLIGVNNQYRGRSVDNFQAEFHALVARAIRLADGNPGRVLVISIPDWSVTRFARGEGRDAAQAGAAIDAFNAVAREETARVDAVWADITDTSRQCGAAVDMLAADGLHPAARQYRLWLPRIRAKAREMLCLAGNPSPPQPSP